MADSERYTGADALTDALVRAGVSYVFLNSGTDYPPIIESWAKYEEKGLPKPEVILCPHEMVALSAAQCYAQITGQAQAVFVHVDVGTQNLGGSIHNAARCRVPAFILAGLSPYTMEGELKGTRNSPVQFIQDVYDQASIVREYTKWHFKIGTAKNIPQLVQRAMQIAHSDPQGPVYLMAAREVLEEESIKVELDPKYWGPIAPNGLNDKALETLVAALLEAENPLIITSYLGRNPAAVPELVKLCEQLAIPVIEGRSTYMNFPANHPLHLGYDVGKFVRKADLILVLDCDLPWVPANLQPAKDCRVFYLDVDPVKENTPLWYIPAEAYLKVDSYLALQQLNKRLAAMESENKARITQRRALLEDEHKRMRAEWKSKEEMQSIMTPEYVVACLREIVTDDTLILDETTSFHPVVQRHLPRNKPGTMIMSGGSALGWVGGAAIGAKLAVPEKDVVALVGDGTYMLTCPAAVYWTARKYKTPFLTVIFNNQGWGAPKLAAKREHPNGYAAKNDTFWVALEPTSQLAHVAEAVGDAFAQTVTDPKEVKNALQEGMAAVKDGKCAVINIVFPAVAKL
ncbi:MAG: thiamine pyrophosphate-requiring protein [Firmicutes bacterium]|nr:thiamine pyrophosphate-requiring protein [Bacillota bacterium]